jgi:putative IMPACT (imprinted ancient) family translation regulator
MTNLPFYVGRNDGTGKVQRFATLKEAEARITEIEKTHPKAVHNGEFYVDGPEELIQAGR